MDAQRPRAQTQGLIPIPWSRFSNERQRAEIPKFGARRWGRNAKIIPCIIERFFDAGVPFSQGTSEVAGIAIVKYHSLRAGRRRRTHRAAHHTHVIPVPTPRGISPLHPGPGGGGDCGDCGGGGGGGGTLCVGMEARTRG